MASFRARKGCATLVFRPGFAVRPFKSEGGAAGASLRHPSCSARGGRQVRVSTGRAPATGGTGVAGRLRFPATLPAEPAEIKVAGYMRRAEKRRTSTINPKVMHRSKNATMISA